MTEIISFYGTDGSGKSTIAREFSAQYKGSESTMIGGSSYKSWLTPEVARLTLGPDHTLGETPGNLEDEMRLYEDIAIACYGFARILAERGNEVVIDSDPYFKRIIWGTLGLNEEESRMYVDYFETRMAERIGENEGPGIIVGINMDGEATSQDELLARLNARESSTRWDPSEIEGIQILDERVRGVWSEINLGVRGISTVNGFNTRIYGSIISSLQNPNCAPDEVITKAQHIAKDLRTHLAASVE